MAALYDDRAEVTRIVKATVPSNESEIVLRNVPVAVVQDSARVSGGVGRVTLLEVVDEVHEERRAVDEAVAKQLRAQEVSLSDEAGRLERQQKRAESIAAFDVPCDVTFSVTYVIANCGWSAVYDVRYHSESSLELTYYASVLQDTGETWEDDPECVLSAGIAVPHKATLLSSKKPRRITVLAAMLPCTLFYRVMPAVSPHAFLEAQTLNSTDVVLPAGPCVVFFETSFVSASTLSAVAPQEEFSVLLGTDPGVHVLYNPKPPQKSASGLLRKSSTMSYEFRTFVQNSKTVPISVEMQQQLPLSTDKRVEVSLRQPAMKGESVLTVDENTAVSLLPNNNLCWMWLNVPAGGEVRADLAYTVTWPSDVVVDGL
eukprot:m51a1_g2733 hypothetical protein (372) ;mRNA; f:894129-896059